MNVLSRLFKRPIKFLFNVNSNCVSAVLLGCIAGFPIGAKCVAILYIKGLCSKSEAEKILPYCNNAGPAFIIGALGDYRLYIVQILSAVICGVIFSFPRRKVITDTTYIETAPISLSAAIINAGTSLISVCGHICFFSFLLTIIVKFITNPFLITLICGFTEITSGIKCTANMPHGLAFAGLFCGWSGLSVHMQISSFLSPHGISAKYCIIGKLLQGIIMFFILLFIK